MSSAEPSETGSDHLTGHGGTHAVAAATAHGQDVMWTLSGAHVFPVYDAAVGGKATVEQSEGDTMRAQREGPMRLIDVRHEATAAFAAEATGKLTRSPGFAVVTAGPGVTNTVSAITGAWFNGSPMVVLGGRSPAGRWGQGALQELDHPPLVASVTKDAFTVDDPEQAGTELDRAFRVAGSPHRGPVFVDIPMDVLFSYGQAPPPSGEREPAAPVDHEAVTRIAQLLASAERPVLILGGDVWMDGADATARAVVEQLDLPVIANGMGRGILPRGHECLVTRARSAAFGAADLVVVVGTPSGLPARLRRVRRQGRFHSCGGGAHRRQRGATRATRGVGRFGRRGPDADPARASPMPTARAPRRTTAGGPANCCRSTGRPLPWMPRI